MLTRFIWVACLLLLAAGGVASAGSIRVVDGDTVDVDGVRYRLHGIDAPEAAQLCNSDDGRQWPCGKVATEKLEELLSHGAVSCIPREKDIYGRWIASCRVNGKDINEAMVSEGLAWAFRKYSLDYVRAEERARSARVGIWQAANEAAWDFRSHKWDSTASTVPQSGCPIKGNINRKLEKIYHAPWSKDYAKTKIDTSKGERWFCSEGEAIAAGWRPPH